MSETSAAGAFATRSGGDERRAIVRWLRRQAQLRVFSPWGRYDADLIEDLARRIEREEHA